MAATAMLSGFMVARNLAEVFMTPNAEGDVRDD